MAGKVAVVTDSLADLNADLRRQHGIEMVPLNVHFGDDVYQDQVSITTAQFFSQLQANPHHPRTSAPAAGQFLECYRRLHGEGRPVLSLHVSSKLSATFQSASIAREMLAEAAVEVVDTGVASMGQGLIALGAARLAAGGASLAEVAAWTRQAAARSGILFGVDTLEYLQKGGRIGRAQALIGGLIGIKPVLTLVDGVVATADKVRGKGKVLPRILELMAERVAEGSRLHAAVIHAQAPEAAQTWAETVSAHWDVAEMQFGEIGPAIGAHVGPGCLGVCFYPDF